MSGASPATEQRARANGIDLAWDSFGDPTATPVLLIMGLNAQMIAWDDDFCRQLAAAGAGHYVIRFDNRDIGHSTYFTDAGVPDLQAMLGLAMAGQPLNAPYLLSDMADDAAGLLDALKIDKAHVVGASMGGAIGQEMAIRHPQRMRSFTSIMSTTGAPGLPPPTPEAMAVLFAPAPAATLEDYLPQYAKVWRVLRGPSAFPDDEARDAERGTAGFNRGLNPAGSARQLAAIFASGSRKAALGGVTVPTLVIHGDADPLVPVGCGIDVAASIPGAKLLRIPRMGHALPVSMWPQIVNAIAEHAAAQDRH